MRLSWFYFAESEGGTQVTVKQAGSGLSAEQYKGLLLDTIAYLIRRKICFINLERERCMEVDEVSR